jgi:histidine triad (HIT) family protein
MEQDCVFCKIVDGKIPSTKVYEDEWVLAFDDIHPMAPVHVDIIPKQHIATLMDVKTEHLRSLEAMVHAVQEVARRKSVDKTGFRLVINCNEQGGQVIFHLHMHVLGGKKLKDALD